MYIHNIYFVSKNNTLFDPSVMFNHYISQQSKQYDDFRKSIKTFVLISLSEESNAYNQFAISKLVHLDRLFKDIVHFLDNHIISFPLCQ